MVACFRCLAGPKVHSIWKNNNPIPRLWDFTFSRIADWHTPSRRYVDILWVKMMHDKLLPIGGHICSHTSAAFCLRPYCVLRMVGPAGSNKFAEKIRSGRSLHCYTSFHGRDGINKATGTSKLFAVLTPGLLIFDREGQNSGAFSPFNNFHKK